MMQHLKEGCYAGAHCHVSNHWMILGDTEPASPPHSDSDLWVEHDDYSPSKPERKVGRHERSPDDTPLERILSRTDTDRDRYREAPPIVMLKGSGIDTDPRVKGSPMADADDILRMKLGDQALDEANLGIREAYARITWQDSFLPDEADYLDNSLDEPPRALPDRVRSEIDESLE